MEGKSTKSLVDKNPCAKIQVQKNKSPFGKTLQSVQTVWHQKLQVKTCFKQNE